MSSWSSGNFENDTALDWVGEFLEKPEIAEIRKMLATGYKIKDGPEWDKPLAAAEAVALLRGHPSKDCPEELLAWASRNQKDLKSEMVTLTKKVVSYVVKISRSKENVSLWYEKADHTLWLKTQQGLSKRLSASYKKLPELAEEEEPEEDTGPRYVIVGYDRVNEEKGSFCHLIREGKWIKIENLPTKISAKPRPGLHFTIMVSLDDYFTTNELTKLTQWLSRHGNRRIMLNQNCPNDFVYRRDADKLLRAIAPDVEFLELYLDGADYGALATAKRLKKLCLKCGRSAKSSRLDFLEKLKSLEILQLNSPINFTKDVPLCQLNNLKSLNISVHRLESNCLPQLPPFLEELTLRIQSSNIKTDLSAIGKLKHLKYLKLRIAHSVPLPNTMRELLWFKVDGNCFIGGNKWNDLSFLRGSPDLRHLELDTMNGLKDISILSTLPHLQRLKLCRLDLLPDVLVLESLPKLETLQLLRLKRIKRLPRLPKLKRLQVGVPQRIEAAESAHLKEWNLQGKYSDLEEAKELRKLFPVSKHVPSIDHWPFPYSRSYSNYFH